MNLWNIGIKNIKNNFKLYQNYFLSMLLMLTLFNTVELFSLDKIIAENLAGSSRIKSMSSVILSMFTLFIIFYILYFNKFFLKQRSNELGIYSMLGLSKKEICSILNSENLISFLGAFTLNIFTSTALYLLIKVCLIKGLALDIPWNLDVGVKPYINTLILTFILLIVIIANNYYLINKMSILELSEFDQHCDEKVNISITKAIIGIVSLLTGYGLVLNLATRPNSIWDKIGYSPMTVLTALLITIGTIFVVKNSISFIIHYFISKPKILFNEVNNIFMPQALFKLKTKSNLLIVLSLLISAIIGISSAMFLSISYQKYSLIQTVPSAIETNTDLSKENISKLKNIAQTNNGEQVAISVKKIKLSKSIQITNDIKTKNCQLMKLSEYNKLSKLQREKFKPLKLKENQGILYTAYSLKNKQSIVLDGEKINLKAITLLPIQSLGKVATIVIPDHLFNKINDNDSKIYTINGKNLRDSRKLYLDVKKIGIPFTSSYQLNKEITKDNSPAFLMISFIAILLFISISCVMYSTTLTENLNVREEFKMLSLIGYSKKILKRIAMKNNLLLFIPPLILGLFNGIVLFLGYRYVLLPDVAVKLLGEINIIFLPVTITIIVFSIIYGVVYLASWKKTKKILL